MNKFLSFLKQSSRYKHLVGSLIVGICALSPWSALYSVAIAVSRLELEDKLCGCPRDWIDWAIAVVGRSVAAFIWLLFSI